MHGVLDRDYDGRRTSDDGICTMLYHGAKALYGIWEELTMIRKLMEEEQRRTDVIMGKI